jgi:exodeoxyribonuclease V gamma subunit
MSFHLHESNDLSALAQKLAEILFAGSARSDPFAEETVIVPDQGLARWLRLTLADLAGFCPALDLPYPGAFLYRYVFDPMTDEAAGPSSLLPSPSQPLGGCENDLPFAPATVEWRILALLSRLEREPGFGRVRAFTGGDAFRRWQLAGRLARLFDRYMTYRPDLLGEWERGRNPAEGEDAAWQACLWRELIALDQGTVRHFSGLYQRFIDLIDEDRDQRSEIGGQKSGVGNQKSQISNLKSKISPLLAKRRACYFGVSSLPPAHLDMLVRLARIDGFDLHFFALNPCREEWSDARSLKAQLRDHATLVKAVGPQLAPNYQTPSNPLLGSLGRSGRDFFSLLLAYDDIIEDRLFTTPGPTDAERDAPPVLTAIQRGILDNAAPAAKQAFDPADRSLTVHACHSPMREVEVLHDQLLALFRDLPGLAPRDIGVYTPDVETYAPYIDAVFGRTRPGAPGHIPYAIADKALRHTVEECQAFLSLLAAATGRFKASEMLGLLQNAPIRERFGLAEQDLPRIGSLLKAANLAWGLDAAFREKQGAAPAYANTWRFALDRLILGAAMREPQDGASAPPLALAEGPCIPLPEADGSALLIGRLADFIDALAELHGLCAGEPERTCDEWRDLLAGALARFFTSDARAPYGVILLRQTLDRLAHYTGHAGGGRLAVPFAVVRAWLGDQLAGPPGSERFVTGNVTFSRFQPMRNVPARVVCLLGMNDGAFPRSAPRLSFDLMDRRTGSRVGDRQTRDEDRYAFLEALLAARARLVITYTGQSEKDNKPLPPSVLVSELLDAADAAFAFPENRSAADALTVRHPLHPFSPEYFKRGKPDPRLISFSRPHYAVAAVVAGGGSLRPAPPSTPPTLELPHSRTLELPLDDLVAFFRSPCKYFYTKRLGVILDLRDDDLPDDEERLEPDALDKYALKHGLLAALETDAAPDAADRLRARWEIEGRLPPGTGRLVAEAESSARDLLEKKDALNLGAPRGKLSVDLALDNGVRLQGSPGTLHGNDALLFMRPADEKPKDTAAAWLHHLAACAHGLAVTTHGVYTKNRPYYAPFAPVAPEAARRILTALTDLFVEGMRRPLCFDPAIGKKVVDGKEVSDADWSGSPFQRGSGVDLYLRRAFGETLPDPDSPAWQTLGNVAHALFGTMPKPSPKKKAGGRK